MARGVQNYEIPLFSSENRGISGMVKGRPSLIAEKYQSAISR